MLLQHPMHLNGETTSILVLMAHSQSCQRNGLLLTKQGIACHPQTSILSANSTDPLRSRLVQLCHVNDNTIGCYGSYDSTDISPP